MKVNKDYPGLAYNPVDGSFWRLKRSAKDPRRVFPDDQGYISYKCAFTSNFVKRKAARVAWEILYDCSVQGMHVVHRNLDQNDYRGYNLVALSKEDYVKFRDSSHNLTNCYLRPTGKDMFSYVVTYKKDGKTRYKMLHDVVTALRFKRFVQYLALKYLGKYLNTA